MVLLPSKSLTWEMYRPCLGLLFLIKKKKKIWMALTLYVSTKVLIVRSCVVFIVMLKKFCEGSSPQRAG